MGHNYCCCTSGNCMRDCGWTDYEGVERETEGDVRDDLS
jgi:hypothetical protein